MASERGEVVGISPLIQLKSVLFGNFLVSMPYFNYGGIVADRHDVTIALISSAHELREELGCSHIEMRFDSEQSFDLPALYKDNAAYPAWHVPGLVAFAIPVALTIVAITTGYLSWFYDYGWFTGSILGGIIYYFAGRGQ